MNKHLTYDEYFEVYYKPTLIYKNYFEQAKEIDDLQTRWNSLREWLEELTIPTKTEYGDTTFYDMIKVKFILDKMNELEEDKEG